MVSVSIELPEADAAILKAKARECRLEWEDYVRFILIAHTRGPQAVTEWENHCQTR